MKNLIRFVGAVTFSLLLFGTFFYSVKADNQTIPIEVNVSYQNGMYHYQFSTTVRADIVEMHYLTNTIYLTSTAHNIDLSQANFSCHELVDLNGYITLLTEVEPGIWISAAVEISVSFVRDFSRLFLPLAYR